MFVEFQSGSSQDVSLPDYVVLVEDVHQAVIHNVVWGGVDNHRMSGMLHDLA